ncbi:GDSL-type esterase/lipase family protein [Neobacillus soli]|uniref:GDSL-type esterase/lipase family protein n=1 Tax=Neobacillus soli TaxID=220688 RepID=UPI0008251B13|nr:GDSL-type esterase/lipase family protein [Neobacillus soli]
MRFKRLSVLFALMLMFCTFFSSFAFAESNVKPNLVALGDSITYGWNLEKDSDPTNSQQSLKAYPYLIGNGNYSVAKNISGGGWTSANLLAEISKPENLEAIKNADVITLNIGSNDFLQNPAIQQIRSNPALLNDPIVGPTLLNQLNALIPQISTDLFNNLGLIMGTIRAQNNDAHIIVYNIYNPFSDTLAALYPLGEQFLPLVNTGIQGFAAQTQSLLSDSYAAFKGKQSDLIFPNGDVHPNEEGQKVLANLSTELLAAQVPGDITVDLTPSTTETTKEPVTITVTTTAKKVLAMQRLDGEKTIADFATAGTDITDNKFQVTENGTYTVYVRDSKGAKAVGTIKIDNIKDEDPTPNPGDDGNNPDPNPGDTGNNPDPTPGDTNTDPGDSSTDPGGNGDNPAPNPTETDSPAPTTDNQNTDTGNELPVTASTTYNYMAAGLGLILAGFAVMQIQQYRRRQKA